MNVQRLANGNLLVPVRLEDPATGTLGEGVQEIGPDHADYQDWVAEAPTFIDISMPEQFVLEVSAEDGAWIGQGVFRAEDFRRLDDGSYTSAERRDSPISPARSRATRRPPRRARRREQRLHLPTGRRSRERPS